MGRAECHGRNHGRADKAGCAASVEMTAQSKAVCRDLSPEEVQGLANTHCREPAQDAFAANCHPLRWKISGNEWATAPPSPPGMAPIIKDFQGRGSTNISTRSFRYGGPFLRAGVITHFLTYIYLTNLPCGTPQDWQKIPSRSLYLSNPSNSPPASSVVLPSWFITLGTLRGSLLNEGTRCQLTIYTYLYQSAIHSTTPGKR